jgi:hypothetical protein
LALIISGAHTFHHPGLIHQTFVIGAPGLGMTTVVNRVNVILVPLDRRGSRLVTDLSTGILSVDSDREIGYWLCSVDLLQLSPLSEREISERYSRSSFLFYDRTNLNWAKR